MSMSQNMLQGSNLQNINRMINVLRLLKYERMSGRQKFVLEHITLWRTGYSVTSHKLQTRDKIH